MKSIIPTEGWQRVLAIAFFAQFTTSVAFQMFVPFLPLYVRQLPSTTGMSVELSAGLAVAGAGLTMMFASAFWGAIADRYGRKLMLLRATFGGMILLGLMGVVVSVEQLLVLRLLQGVVTGTVTATAALVASLTPRHRMGYAMSMLQVALWGGLAVGPLVGGAIADHFGYNAPFFVIAVMMAICGTMIALTIREDFHRPANTAENPRLVAQWKHALSAQGITSVLAIHFLAGIGRNLIMPIAAVFVVSLLLPGQTNHNSYAGLVSSVAAITATIGGVWLGRMGDNIGQRRVLIGCALLSVAAYLPQAAVTNVWQLIVLQAVVGFAFGGVLSAVSALLAVYSQAGEEGAVYGIDGSVGSAAFAMAPLVGSLVAATLGMRAVFVCMALIYAGVLLLAYQLPQKRSVPAVAIGD